MSLYYLSFYIASLGVYKIIKNLQRNFPWGCEHDASKIAWVKWENLRKPKSEGGIGIKNIILFNKALLAK